MLALEHLELRRVSDFQLLEGVPDSLSAIAIC